MSTWSERDWAALDALLDAVLEQPPETRLAWLQKQTGDPRLSATVAALLAADGSMGERLERCGEELASDIAAMLDSSSACAPEIPGYRVLDLLGEGGMGSVFLAERSLGEVVQRVALKRLRTSLYDPAERRRFEHEQRILARLEHPSIARFIDAGIAPDGIPWFAMEYVDGQPLLQYCDQRRLGIDARIAVLIEICAAVQYAHQQLVVHRDLKPSNILVDRDGAVKLLDFGIARLLGPDTGPGDTTRTELRRFTPSYAAPEQFEGRIGTATDVYVLGVILVELITGKRPERMGESRSGSRLPAADAADAASRGTSAAALNRLLAGGLGAIARKALRTQPELRYATVEALAGDLGAWREHRPLRARRGDWRYRSACFMRRNLAGVAMAALLFVTLVVAAGSNLREMRRTRIEAEHARAIQEFVEDLIAPVTRGLPGDQHPGLEELLERGVARVQHQAALAPAVRSKLLSMFSRAFQQAGRSPDAEALADEAWRFARFAWGTKDRRTLEAQAHRNLLACQHTDGRERCAGVEAVLHDMRERGMRGPEYGKLQLAHAFARYSRDGNSEAAMRRLREANAFLGPHASHENSNLLLARLHEGGGEHDDALVLYQKIHDEHVRRDGEDRASAYLLGNIAYVQCALGRWRDCNASLDRAVDQLGRIGVRDHPDRLFVYKYACFAAGLHGKPERAEALCNEAVAMAERLYGRQHRDYASALLARGRMRADRGQLAAARADLDNAQTTYSSLPAGARTRRPTNTWLDVARSVVQRVEGDYEGMRQSLSRVVRSGQLDDVGPFPEMLAQLALACAHAPDPDCPDDLVARVDRELAEPSRAHHTVRIRAQMALARLAMFRGYPARALQRLADAEVTTLHPQIAFARDHPVIAEIRLLRGNALEVLGEHDEAMKEWHAAQAVFNRELPPDHPYCLKLASRLGTLLTQPPVTSH